MKNGQNAKTWLAAGWCLLLAGFNTFTLRADVIDITEGSTSGYTLTDGNTYVVKNWVLFSNSEAGGSGLSVADNATVVLYLPAGVTLVAQGAAGSGKTGGGAGIRIPETSTLVITGEGTVNATGGKAGNGGNGTSGSKGSSISCRYGTYPPPGSTGVNITGVAGKGDTGKGGAGGNGGGGAGAAVGGFGGQGGSGGNGGAALTMTNYNNAVGYSCDGKAGASGGAGTAGGGMGNCYALGTINMVATAGEKGTAGSAGGYADHITYAYNYYSDYYHFSTCGGGGGGGGGAGAAPSCAIGGGGSSGGGGGGGGSGARAFRDQEYYSSYPLVNAHGGGGNGGQSSSSAGASGAAKGKTKNGYYKSDTTSSFWKNYKYGGEGGAAGVRGAEGGAGTLYVSPTATVNVERTTTTATTYPAAQYTITFDANGGEFGSAAESVTVTLGCGLPDCIPAPTRRQHVFGGWKTADGVEYYDAIGAKSLSSYPAAGDVTLLAQWEFKGQTIDFPEIGAQIATNTVTLEATASSGLAVSYALDGPGVLDGAVLSFTGAGTVTVTASQAGDDEWGAAEEVVRSFEVTKAVAEVTLSGLNQTYDGEAKAVTVETVPEGLSVAVTYDGEEGAPVNAGSYGVVATVVDDVWDGRAEGTLVIGKGTQTIEFGEIGEQTVTNAVELGAVASSGLAVGYGVEGPAVLEGGALRFTGTGSVTVTASQAGDGNWEAAEDVARSFEVVKASATVTLGRLAQRYDGTAKAVSVSTVPEGLNVTVTYDGSGDAPQEIGHYTVVATVEDAMWAGSAEGTLVITMPPEVLNVTAVQRWPWNGLVDLEFAVDNPEGATLSSFTATDGETGTSVAMATLTKEDGTAVAEGEELAAGTHRWVWDAGADMEDGFESDSMTAECKIRGRQSVYFTAIGNRHTEERVTLFATATSGGAVTFSVQSGPGSISGNVLSFTGTGTVVVAASQAGDEDWWPASATQSVNVEWPLYMVVNLSGGANASSYPVTYLSAAPSGGFNTDAYKTTKLILRRIPAGSFKMGGSYQVTLTKPFYAGLFEVTQKQWTLVMGSNPSNYSGDKRPVETVSWNAIRGNSLTYDWPGSSAVDTNSFVGRIQIRTGLAFDLPTEAQWEYACRAGTTSSYNNGGSTTNDLSKLGRYWDNGGSSSHHAVVGSYQPNAWGLYDMHGNVYEWCLDWYYGSLSGGTDPKGSSSGSRRVTRGGCWYDSASNCSSSYRYSFNPSGGSYYYGFRLVRTLSN